MIWMWFIAAVTAGQWLPEAPVDLSPGLPMAIAQQAGQGLLLRSENADAHVTAQAEGLFLVLKNGPDGSLLLPPALRTREVTIRVSESSRIEQWKETGKGDAASWDRFESKLARWMRTGGALPQSPQAVAALAVDWEARREAFLSLNGKVSPGILMGFAILELETVRERSKADHPTQVLPSGRLPQDETWTIELQGPGLLHLNVRAEMEGKNHRRYQLIASAGEKRIFRSELSSIENPAMPGLGYVREAEIVIPPGQQSISLRADGASLRVDAVMHDLRPTIRSIFGGWHRAKRVSDRPLKSMERAHLFWDAPTVVRQATLLLDGREPSDPVALLATARLIEHLPDTNTAIDLWNKGPQSPIAGTALLRRWQLKQDVPLDILVEAADLLPADPKWLAAIADALPAGFIRPRGQAIRELAGLPWGSDTHSRWTVLDPDEPLSTLHLAGSRGGIGRVLIRGDQSAKVQLPHLGTERFPLLRLYTQVNTEYTVDGEIRRGKGLLFEALTPGIHTIDVKTGALLLLDGNLAIGGQFMRERPLSGVPGRFVLPDTGAPIEIEVLISGGQGQVIARTDTGQTWALDAIEPLNRYAIRPGAWASDISFEGAEHLRVSVAMRRALEVDEPFASSAVLNDPLLSLHTSSQAMHQSEEDQEIIGLRLLRAAALEALGLLRSAREEARAAATHPAAVPKQKRIAEVILRQSQPLALSAEETGPTTVDAAAAYIRLEAPTEPAELLQLAELLGSPDSAPLYLELARTSLAEGRIAEAWVHAQSAGKSGRVDRLRIANAGTWEHITRVDNNDGASSHEKGRLAAGLGASPLRLAREAMMGAPWPKQDYLLLDGSKAASFQLQGKGPVILKAVCADWGHRAEAPPCTIPILINGVAETTELKADTEGEWALGHLGVKGELRIGPLSDPDQALAVWVSHNGQHLAPESRHVRHRVGDGIKLRVRGESLLRVRVHGKAAVTVQSLQNNGVIQGEGIFPLPEAGWQQLTISGPPNVTVSLDRLNPRARPREQSPDPLRSNLAGTSDKAAAKATEHWMSEVALQHRSQPFAVGRQGTISVTGLGGLDQSGQRDHRLDYEYGGASLAWNKRLGANPDWLRLETQYRRSTSGHPGLWAQGEWVHVAPRWATELRFDGGISNGANHIRNANRVRGFLPLGSTWIIQPWLETRLGFWSEDIGDPVDPLVWNTYDQDHPWSVTLGTLADWRPLRDARFRFGTHARSTADWGLNWAEGYLRTDWMMGHHVVATLLPAMGRRFEGSSRQTAYWRPRLNGRLTVSGYATSRLRVELAGTAQWLPLQQGLEGGVQLSFQLSPQRGLRDFSPLSMPFSSALDSRVETP
jgi:hypothetical protein